jgi:hypothetical protein
MSWGYEKTGTRDALLADIAVQFPKMAAGYNGNAEADDIVTCAGRAAALIAAMVLGKDSSDYEWNAIVVKANGSHSTTTGGPISANFTLSVQRTSLAL